MSGVLIVCASMGAQRHITIYETLKRIGDAESLALDVWSVSLTGGLGHSAACAAADATFSPVLHTLREKMPGLRA